MAAKVLKTSDIRSMLYLVSTWFPSNSLRHDLTAICSKRVGGYYRELDLEWVA